MTKFDLFNGTDAVEARRICRQMAEMLGFSMADQIRIALTVTELASNILLFAELGTLEVDTLAHVPQASGLQIRAVDAGPGIANVGLAMKVGYSTAGRLGMGLPGAKSLMDEFELHTDAGKGTIVTTRKWLYELPRAE